MPYPTKHAPRTANSMKEDSINVIRDWPCGLPTSIYSATLAGDGDRKHTAKTLIWADAWEWRQSEVCKDRKMPNMTNFTPAPNTLPFTRDRNGTATASMQRTLLPEIYGKLTFQLSKNWYRRQEWKKWCALTTVLRAIPAAAAIVC